MTQVAHTVRFSALTISYPRYDPVGNRLTMADAAGTHTYTYDPFGRRLTKTGRGRGDAS